MGFTLCLVVPVAILLVLLILCKLLNFSIIPEGLRLPPPKKFKIPQVRRNGYKWEAWDIEDDFEDDDDTEDDDTEDDDIEDEDEDEDDEDDWEF